MAFKWLHLLVYPEGLILSQSFQSLKQKITFLRPNEAFKVLKMFLIFGLSKPYVLIKYVLIKKKRVG